MLVIRNQIVVEEEEDGGEEEEEGPGGRELRNQRPRPSHCASV